MFNDDIHISDFFISMTLLDSGWYKCVNVKTNKFKKTGKLDVQMKTMGLGVVLDGIVNHQHLII